MKKILTALLLCAVMVMAFAACSSSDTSEVVSSTSVASDTVVSSEAVVSEASSVVSSMDTASDDAAVAGDTGADSAVA